MKHELMVISQHTIQIMEIKNPFEPKKRTIRTVPVTNGTVFSYLNPTGKIIYYNGCLVPDPAHFYPQDGQLIVTPHVGKGLGKILGWAAMIALTVYAGGIGATWFQGTKAFGASLLRTLAAGAVITLGGRVINSICHIDQTNESSETNYGWNLPEVQTTEGGVIGETFGEVMPTPQLLEEHVETNNSDDEDSNVQYLDLLLCGGWGPVDKITNLRIGTTGLEDGSFDDVQLETRLGTNDQKPISFFPDSVLDQSVGMQIVNGKSVVRTTETNKAQRLDVTIEFPSGIYYVNDNSSYGKQKVNFRIEYRKTGDADWINPVTNNNYVANTYQLEKGTSSAIYRTYTIAQNLTAGQYDVRVTGENLPTGTRYCTYMQWNTLSSFIYDGAKTHPGKVLVALRIKATNQLSGSLPNVNWRQWRNTAYVWNPNTSAYEAKSARNPIWAAYAILHKCKLLENINTGQSEYVVEGSDKKNFTQYYDQWVEAAAYADDQIDNNNGGTEARFEFDAFYNTAISTWTAAQKAAAVGHATIIRHGTQYGVTVDKPGTICQIFGEGQTTVSSVKGSFASVSDRAKAVEMIYNDTNNDFKNTPMKIYSPTYANDLTVQDNTPQITLFGVKRRSQAYREGYYYLATNECQLQSIRFGVDIAGIVCQYGDIIGYNHSISQLGMASGRIVSASGNTVILDKEVELSADTTYMILISLSVSDTIVKAKTVPVAADTTTHTLTVTTAFDSAKMPAQYDPYAFGLVDKAVKPFRIIKTERDGDNRVTLTVAEYNEAVYAIDYSKYPVIDYTNPVSLKTPINLVLKEINYTSNDSAKVHVLRASWSMPNESLIADSFYVYVSPDNASWTLWGKIASMTTDITNVNPPRTYYVKVCAVSKEGITSGYISGSLVLVGDTVLPLDLTAFSVTYLNGNYVFSWKKSTDNTGIEGYEIRKGTTWDSGQLVTRAVGKDVDYAVAQAVVGTVKFFCKPYNSAGYSENAVSDSITIDVLPSIKTLYRKKRFEQLCTVSDSDGVITSAFSYQNTNVTYAGLSAMTYANMKSAPFVGTPLGNTVLLGPVVTLDVLAQAYISIKEHWIWPPDTSVVYEIATSLDGVTFGDFKLLGAGKIPMKAFRLCITLAGSSVAAILEHLDVEVNASQTTINYSNIKIPQGGLTLTYSQSFAQPPAVIVSPNADALTVKKTNPTVTECTIYLLDYSSGKDVGGTADVVIVGI